MHAAVKPAQLAKEGKSAFERGDFRAAAQAFEAAAVGYAAAEDVLSAAEMRNNCSVALLQAGDAPGALNAVEGTEALFAQSGDLRRQGMAVGNRAAALEAMGSLDEAMQEYERAAGLLQQAGEDQLRLNVMQALSALQLRTGRQLQALASMQAGLEGVQRLSPQRRMLKRLLRLPMGLLGSTKK